MAPMVLSKDSLEAPLVRVLEKFSYHEKKPKVTAVFLSFMPTLFINDYKMVNELYITKNKYFDKHDLVRDVMKRLMGDSILLAKSTEDWAKKRKTISPAFYKEKLNKMVDITKSIVNKSIEQIREKHVKTGTPMDLAKTISNTH
jgi:cytochrome P450